MNHTNRTRKTMKSKESVSGIRGPSAPQMARKSRAQDFAGMAVPQGRPKPGPRKKSPAGPVKTRSRKDSSR